MSVQAHGSFVEAVPFDPFLPYIFMGEEIALSIRFWTSGFDIYAPTVDVLAHEYVRKEHPKFWETVSVQAPTATRVQAPTATQLPLTFKQLLPLAFMYQPPLTAADEPGQCSSTNCHPCSSTNCHPHSSTPAVTRVQ